MAVQDEILFARAGEDIVVVKPVGHGTMALAPCLRQVDAELSANGRPLRYVVDLSDCASMDSTFMGTLAGLALHQQKATGRPMVVVNAGETPRRQMKTLGLNYMLKVYPEDAETAGIANELEHFERVRACDVSDVERIVHMIESHQTLVDMNSGNELKFRSVLEHLEQSLKRAAQKEQNPSGK